MNVASCSQHALSTGPQDYPGPRGFRVKLRDRNTIDSCVTLAAASRIVGPGVNQLLSAEQGLPDAGAMYRDTAVRPETAGK